MVLLMLYQVSKTSIQSTNERRLGKGWKATSPFNCSSNYFGTMELPNTSNKGALLSPSLNPCRGHQSESSSIRMFSYFVFSSVFKDILNSSLFSLLNFFIVFLDIYVDLVWSSWPILAHSNCKLYDLSTNKL